MGELGAEGPVHLLEGGRIDLRSRGGDGAVCGLAEALEECYLVLLCEDPSGSPSLATVGVQRLVVVFCAVDVVRRGGGKSVRLTPPQRRWPEPLRRGGRNGVPPRGGEAGKRKSQKKV